MTWIEFLVWAIGLRQHKQACKFVGPKSIRVRADRGDHEGDFTVIMPCWISAETELVQILPGKPSDEADMSDGKLVGKLAMITGGSDESIALRRDGTANVCAGVVEFLATDLSDYVIGRKIPIDGGRLR